MIIRLSFWSHFLLLMMYKMFIAYWKSTLNLALKLQEVLGLATTFICE